MNLKKINERTLNSLGLLFMRVSIGLMMILAHGVPKLSLISSGAIRFPDPLGVGVGVSLGLAIFGELICSIAIILGFKVRLAAVFPLITMLVVALLVHAGDPWSKKELPLLYAISYLVLIFTGGGAYTLKSVRK